MTQRDVVRFQEDGYLLVEGLFSHDEVDLLRQIGKRDQALAAGAVNRIDADGHASRIALRYELGDDVYSAVVRSRRLVTGMEQLLGGPVCYFHHKMMMKEAQGGGAWEWHQDYGYWYEHEWFLWPDLASCMIAVDPCTRENGCLQVIRGSHRLGRLNHVQIGDQTGADPARVAHGLVHLDHVYAEMAPGDALFFHANTLHRSDANSSPQPRWTLIGCYWRLGNVAARFPAAATAEPVVPVADERVLAVAREEAGNAI